MRHTEPPRTFLGRAVPMDELLPDTTASELRRRNIEVIHPAFALTVPIHMAGIQ